MNKVLFALLLSGACCFGQQKEIRLIVRGDDMGYTHSGNEALIESHVKGVETSIEIIAASPWFPEAVKLLRQNPNVDVGIHLALTSEWDNIKWRPLTQCPSLCDADGYFFPKIYPDAAYPKQALLENAWKLAEIEAEFRAQIELVKKYVPRVSHISGHMNCSMMTDEVKALSNRLAKEYGLLNDIHNSDVVGIGYSGPAKTSAEKLAAFKKTIETLEAGKTYMFLDHPGFDNAELRAVHHIGYEHVAEDRQGVTDLFTNPEIKKLLKKRNVKLISYADLRK
ncbi:MAG: ChbG/HpnK family deacetylase [Flavobacterium sp.]|uniref:polysaccharide deacetylase family protein n=1 Tax=Flavobacterium sp. TaxID=239 RepID=UPI0012116E57|nr:polysaccharide deacetylase family protein [Flavobacterium sp.]RZJ66151.1 MAG: ChbG/HpnK family deacetylase [Flavobacterium sp.]